jgi:uncharacterized membrane protein YagU involved in acid resistance
MEYKNGIIAGIAAGIILVIISSLFMMIPGITEWYSTTMAFMSGPGAMTAIMVSIFMMGIFMGIVYSVVNSAVPGVGMRKGVNYGIMVWLLAGLMWPIMMMGFAPAYVWTVEIISGLINYSIAGAVLAIIYEKM